MVCDSNTGEQRHGLGLLIVKQIAQAHGGRVVLDHSPQGGFLAKILFPKDWRQPNIFATLAFCIEIFLETGYNISG